MFFDKGHYFFLLNMVFCMETMGFVQKLFSKKEMCKWTGFFFMWNIITLLSWNMAAKMTLMMILYDSFFSKIAIIISYEQNCKDGQAIKTRILNCILGHIIFFIITMQKFTTTKPFLKFDTKRSSQAAAASILME